MMGCGGAGSPHAVQVVLTAPSENAVVNTSALRVFGTVQPSSANVDIAGKRVRVSHGSFARWLTLRAGRSHIRIVATAAGYLPDRMDVAVMSEPTGHTSRRVRSAESVTISSPTRPAPVNHYRPIVQATFLRACKAEAGVAGAGSAAADARCECALTRIEARVSEATLAADERAFLEGRATLPSWYREAVLSCRAA
jgi:hypothetical protein